MHRVYRGWDEVKFLVEIAGSLVFRMHRKCADPGNCRPPARRVAVRRATEPSRCPGRVSGDPRQDAPEAWSGSGARETFRWTLRRFLSSDLADSERVEADDGIIHEPKLGLRRSRLLVYPGEPQRIAIEFFDATIEVLDRVIRTKLFDSTAGITH